MRMRLLLTIIMAMLATNAMAQEADVGTEEQREAGHTLYLQKCAQCHGEAGAGDGIAAMHLLPRPRDFTAGLFKFRTTANGELPLHADIVRSIRTGMPYTGMPAWPQLSDGQVNDLVYYIKSLNDFFSNPAFIPEPIDIPEPPSFSQESAARGRQVYEANQCFDCHGNAGRGDGKSAPTLKDQWEHPIRPADMTKRWTFRGGHTRRDIYRTFTTGLDGTPMPAFLDISDEDRWALVDYVYSLSRDDPEYGTMVIGTFHAGDLDLNQGEALFAAADSSYFPVVGQVIEPGREFFPGVNGVYVKAVYNQDEIAFMLSWDDMVANRDGSNAPDLPVPLFDADTTGGTFSDAVAMQFPAAALEGNVMPYFLFGDERHPVDLWFADLAGPTAHRYEGRGAEALTKQEDTPAVKASYEDGRWVVLFKRARAPEAGATFAPETFVPFAISVWDGFNGERGNRRGITSWYHVYLEPAQQQSAALPMAGYGLLTLVLELGFVFAVRRSRKKKATAAS